MNSTDKNDSDQAAMWNGSGARGWVEAQEILDRLWSPVADLLLDAIQPGDNVLEVGCGTGDLAVRAARQALPGGTCTAVDISEPMIEAARLRSERERMPVNFICADAQDYAFTPGSFTRVISRFGVMFFRDPVQAFANLRASARPGAQVQFVAWRGLGENPFMTTAEKAAAPLVQLPERRNGEPGQFGFADANRVSGILQQSGWTEIEVRPLNVPCRLTEPEFLRFVSLIGPVGGYLQGADDKMRAQVMDAVTPAFDAYRSEQGLRFDAACWNVTAGNQT